jgi:long-chain acyl-CoA synthetase
LPDPALAVGFAAPPMPSSLAAAFAASCRAEPGALLAWTKAGAVTRAELAAAADAVATALPLPRGGRLAVSVRDPLRFLAVVLAAWRADAAVVLLDAADPQGPRRDLAQRFGAAAIATDAATACGVELAELGPGERADGFAAVKLTSGSTDLPRGIGVSAAALRADAAQLEATMGIGDGDRVFAAVPMSFSYGVGNLLVPALVRGRALVLPDASNPLGFLQAMRDGAPTVLPAVPALLRALLQHARELPASLRLVLSAGAVLPPEVARGFRQRFGLPVHSFYGSTESGGICFDRVGDAAERGCVGAPVQGVDVTIDGDGRVVVASRAVGEALAGGDNPRGGVFRAPDHGELVDGELRLLGRTGEAFDVGGHKVHPREVEQVVAEVAGVAEAVVVPWRDRDGRATVAALVAARGVDAASIRRHCAAKLPPAKVPRCLCVVAELPRSERGKLQRAVVEQLLAAADRGEAAS